MTSKTVAKLRDPEYRKAFVSSQINIGIPFQIRGLLHSRGWKQEDLVKRTGMLQPRISALLRPGKVRPNIETLRRIAEAFDCGLEVRFVPFGDLVRWSERFNPEHFNIPTFDEEIEQAEELENAVIAALSTADESSFVTVEKITNVPTGWVPFEMSNVRSHYLAVHTEASRILPQEFIKSSLSPASITE
jgi:transcriptional regulator with XRE-family HTH domain